MKKEVLESGTEHPVLIFGKDSPLAKELEFLYRVTDQADRSYKLYQGGITQSPVVYSCKSGKYFMLPWPKIIKAAVEAGVDDEGGTTERPR